MSHLDREYGIEVVFGYRRRSQIPKGHSEILVGHQVRQKLLVWRLAQDLRQLIDDCIRRRLGGFELSQIVFQRLAGTSQSKLLCRQDAIRLNLRKSPLRALRVALHPADSFIASRAPRSGILIAITSEGSNLVKPSE